MHCHYIILRSSVAVTGITEKCQASGFHSRLLGSLAWGPRTKDQQPRENPEKKEKPGDRTKPWEQTAGKVPKHPLLNWNGWKPAVLSHRIPFCLSTFSVSILFCTLTISSTSPEKNKIPVVFLAWLEGQY